MGRGQVVRQRVLVPLFGGSNPSVPEHTNYIRIKIALKVGGAFDSMPIPFILKVSYLEKPYVSYPFAFSMMHSRSKSERKASIFPIYYSLSLKWGSLIINSLWIVLLKNKQEGFLGTNGIQLMGLSLLRLG